MGVADAQLQDKVPVTLACRDFVVKVVPMARVRQLTTVVEQVAGDLSDVSLESPDAIGKLIDKFLGFPYAILSVFIDGLPPEIFTDEQNGVTFPEFWTVLQIALTINRVDQLKNVFSRLTTLQSQTSTLPKTNS